MGRTKSILPTAKVYGAAARYVAAQKPTSHNLIYVSELKLEFKLRNHGSVVRRAFPRARLSIYLTPPAGGTHRRAGQNQVNAQSVIATERGRAIVPPTIRFVRLFETAKHID